MQFHGLSSRNTEGEWRSNEMVLHCVITSYKPLRRHTSHCVVTQATALSYKPLHRHTSHCVVIQATASSCKPLPSRSTYVLIRCIKFQGRWMPYRQVFPSFRKMLLAKKCMFWLPDRAVRPVYSRQCSVWQRFIFCCGFVRCADANCHKSLLLFQRVVFLSW